MTTTQTKIIPTGVQDVYAYAYGFLRENLNLLFHTPVNDSEGVDEIINTLRETVAQLDRELMNNN